jgi:hypothetical protein
MASGLVLALPRSWPGPKSVGVVCLVDKGAVVLSEFLYRRPEAAGERGKDGFIDDPFLGRVIKIVINRNQVIEGLDQFGFGLGGVEVGRCRRLLFLGFPAIGQHNQNYSSHPRKPTRLSVVVYVLSSATTRGGNSRPLRAL